MKMSRSSPEPVKSASSPSSRSKLRKHATFDSYYATQNAQRKRAKRQTAGALVTGLLGQPQPVKLTPSGKKSTAQPRPQVTVPPRGIGPVLDPNDNDVLCGRGGRINAHVGNVKFREMVIHRKKEYLSPQTKKLEKAHIAAQVVHDIRAKDPPGRFLKEDPDGSWYDIGDAKAIKKVGQALREDASEVRNHSDEEAAADTKPTSKKSVAIPQQAVKQQQQQQQHYPSGASISNNSQGGGLEPLAFQPVAQPSHPGMGPPLGLGGVAGFPTNQYSNMRRNNAISGAAAALMEQEDNPLESPLDVAFGRTFHIAERDPSELSGLTNSVVTGMSGLTDKMATRSTLSGRRPFPPHRGHNPHAVPPRQLQQLRHAWEVTGSSRTMKGSDLVAQATMPATAPPPPPPPRAFRRSYSWQDNLSYVDNMSWAENSLVGGGIHDNASLMSARSMYSQQMRNDADSLYEQLTMGSVASRRSNNQVPYSQTLYNRNPSPPQQPSGGASVASMSLASLASGGLASLGSVKSIMSDLSANLVALDLAEPQLRDDYHNVQAI